MALHASTMFVVRMDGLLRPKFGLSDRWVITTTNDFAFWLVLGLRPNSGLSVSLSERHNSQKVK